MDNGIGKLLSNIEWYDQRDNAGDSAKGVYGYNKCQLTSLAMVMNAMGIKRKRSDCQFEDELYDVANLAGYGGSKLWEDTWNVYKKVLDNYNAKYIDISNDQINSAKKRINNGIPVILSMDYYEDGNHGHVIVIVGYTDKGLIVNDPYGNRNSGQKYSSHDIIKGDGAFEEYEYGRFYIGKKWALALNINNK